MDDTKRDLAAGSRPAVILVDDVADNLFALEAMLRRDEIEILTARSGREALELLLHRSIALAIIDVQMPEMDGFELAGLMRGVERTRHVPIIFVTAGWGDQERVFTGYEAGAVDFLFKPIEAQVLQSKVDVFVMLEKQRQELRRSEARFRSLVESTSLAVWRAGPDGKVIEDSPSFRRLTGMSLPDWMESRWIEAVHPEDRELVAGAWESALRSRCPYEAEFRLRRANGEHIWTAARAAPVLDESGAVLEWIGSNADIQQRKEAEVMRELFIGILGHDLRSPLGAILNSAQVVLARAQDEVTRSSLSRIQTSGERMARLISQVLDLTRMRFGTGLALEPAPMELSAAVQQVLGEIPAEAGRVRCEWQGDTRGSWDPDRMQQLISNLVWNALEHGTAGAHIGIQVDGREADHVELRVENAGVIPEELRPVLFEPFRGAQYREARTSRGLGLGLYISQQIALAHGGEIGFESSDGRTRFKLRLPR